jgi:hypothetical protein
LGIDFLEEAPLRDLGVQRSAKKTCASVVIQARWQLQSSASLATASSDKLWTWGKSINEETRQSSA